MMRSIAILALLAMGAEAAQEPAAPADAAGLEFFEQNVRPILVERCYSCHSAAANKVKGNLLLDTRQGTLRGGDLGPSVVPGDPDRSLLVKAVRYADENLQMPPKKKLPAAEIADLEAWVKRGAPDPRTEGAKKTGLDPAKLSAHWAYQPLGRSPLRTVDDFIRAGLQKKGLAPSPAADRRTLLRRATYDLTGLPPTADELDAFATDQDPHAYEKTVDRLLASPRYGERWGRYWLDVARYADTKGYVYSDRDESRIASAWAYRDWVIRAFNEDLPFDRFLMLQLAADRLVTADDRRDLAAMGFLTGGPRFLQNIHDIIDDRIDTLGRGMMGLTISCARCHDHKFDPIPTRDYYSLYGVLASSTERIVPVAEVEKTPAGDAFAAELKKRQDALETLIAKKRDQLLDRLRSQTPMYLAAVTEVEKLHTEEFYSFIQPDDVNPVVARRWHQYLLETKKSFHPIFAAWTAFQSIPEKELAEKAPAWLDANKERLHPRVAQVFAAEAPRSMKDVAARYGKLLKDALAAGGDPELREILTGPASPISLPRLSVSELEWYFDEGTRVEIAKGQRAIEQLIVDTPASPPCATILEDKPQLYSPRVFRRGNPANKAEEVPRQFLGFLSGPDRKPFADGSGRLELARAVASPTNPLTARVWVNRVWLNHFGRGLVSTPSDFGLRSDAPSHPELLDFLARGLIEDGWSTKKLHRRILLSETYRQSSEDNAAARAVDPENRLLWRANRRRLDWEAMRDSFLAVSGRLDPAIGGRAVPFTGTRRTVYGFVDRLNIPGMLRAFDFASVDASSPQRHQTTVPQQALFLMNSPFMREQARGVVQRSAGAPDKIRALYRAILGREPGEEELRLGRTFLDKPEPPPVAYKPGPWLYGVGEVDEATQTVKSFTALPHYTGRAWQGGAALPDPVFGWAFLTAQGGHAGNDLKHATIRRWTAPNDGSVTVSGTVAHKTKTGNGIRARLISSRGGELASWKLRQLEAEMKLKGLEVKKGDTLDFVVDFNGEITDDEFVWAPVVQMKSASAANAGQMVEWNAAAQFGGPPAPPATPLERYAQTLLLTNEFLFLD
ncbi:MAG: PSD1 domain-containing protein [Planctomycetaceae bacterium]|nr:PSD1 domain-containing protein [Planctomycetaceae bacterium]